VMPYRKGLNTFFIRLTIHPSSKCYIYSIMLIIEPLIQLESGVPITMTLNDSIFMEYKVQHIGTSFLLFEASCSSDIIVYASATHNYPSDKDHMFIFGDISDE
jgi:hypothetical protein